MDTVSLFKKIGFSEKEARVYLLIIEDGDVTVGAIIKKLHIYSKTAYEILGKLIEKGILGTTIKSGVKHYYSLDPRIVIDMIKSKEEMYKETRKSLEAPLLNLFANRKKNQTPYVNVLEGKKALKIIFEEALKKNKEIFVFGGGGKFKDTFPEYAEIWHNKRTKKKVKLKLLLSEPNRTKKESYLFTEIKFLPSEFENPAPAMIYGDKVALILWTTQPIAFLIESKDIAQSFKNYFYLLWKTARS